MESVDLRALRALTHPLRLDLMELLTAHGPATAAECGRALGSPQANCSFHLRQLAKYGYVEEADPGEDRRERRWRVAESRPEVRVGPQDGFAGRRLERLVVERETQAILDHVEGRVEGRPRSEADMILSAVAAVTPREAAELKERLRELLEPYLVTADQQPAEPQEEREHIRVFIALTPTASVPVTDRGE
jgi:predicted ArsR family transcriptional regulator